MKTILVLISTMFLFGCVSLTQVQREVSCMQPESHGEMCKEHCMLNQHTEMDHCMMNGNCSM